METTHVESKTTRHSLAAVVTDVLGDLAFMVSDGEPAEMPHGAVWLQCEVSYEGPVHGTLCCWCTRDFAIQLAANLLGIEVDEGDAQAAAEDAVREFMNVLCGQLLTAWYGKQAVFAVTIPVVRECAEPQRYPGGNDESRCQVSISGEPFCCAHSHWGHAPE
jgi:hypothetical protein